MKVSAPEWAGFSSQTQVTYGVLCKAPLQTDELMKVILWWLGVNHGAWNTENIRNGMKKVCCKEVLSNRDHKVFTLKTLAMQRRGGATPP